MLGRLVSLWDGLLAGALLLISGSIRLFIQDFEMMNQKSKKNIPSHSSKILPYSFTLRGGWTAGSWWLHDPKMSTALLYHPIPNLFNKKKCLKFQEKNSSQNTGTTGYLHQIIYISHPFIRIHAVHPIQPTNLPRKSKVLGGLLNLTVLSSSSSALESLDTVEGSNGLSLIICRTTYLQKPLLLGKMKK